MRERRGASMRRPLFFATGLLAITAIASKAEATTCYVSGTMQIQSMDSYYCDTGVLSSTACDGWTEKNLDSQNKPMRYMQMSLHDAVTMELLDVSATDANGGYTLSFEAPSCANRQVIVSQFFVRVHENDIDDQVPRIRFQVGDTMGMAAHRIERPVTLIGSITPHSITHPRATSAPGLNDRIANVYYTVNSAITTMLTWHGTISDYFVRLITTNDQFIVRYNPTFDYGYSGIADPAQRQFVLSWYAYGWGDIIRHELGHIIHYLSHNGQKGGSCNSYRFGDDMVGSLGTHGPESCEWGQASTSEAFATFFGIRSIVTKEDNPHVWNCSCHNPANADVCSESVALMSTDADVYRSCPGTSGAISGVGDSFSFFQSKCMRLKRNQSCNNCIGAVCTPCTDTSPSDNVCDQYVEMGFRSEMNVVRWLWDIVDGTGDVTGEGIFDDTNRSIGMMFSILRGMPCSSPGSDNDCNEANASPCVPASEIGDAPADSLGSRDAYNPRDLNLLFDSVTSNIEMTNNCLSGADD